MSTNSRPLLQSKTQWQRRLRTRFSSPFGRCPPLPRFLMMILTQLQCPTPLRLRRRSIFAKFQSYRPINDTSPSIFVFGSIIIGKEPLAELKFSIFLNWFDTRLKMETHEPRVYPTILGGVSRGFWSPFEDLGARSAIFWHLKTGTFAKIWLDFDSQ